MNAYDILEEQGFLQSLSNTNRIIYLRINSSNLLRSWIIFYSFCLKNEAIRYRVQRFDYTPFDARAFKFRHPYNVYGLEGIPIAHARAVWKKMFEMWARCTLHSPYFEVFRTPSMGLGLRSLVNTSLMTMSSEVHGFLDYISEAEEEETKVFHLLASSNHPSLFWGHTEQNGDQNAILFGPLSLCNSNQWIGGGNLNRQGR